MLKAVALGATAGEDYCFEGFGTLTREFHLIVGIGRPFLYAFSSYGQDGVERALKILQVFLFTSADVEKVDNILCHRTSSR